MVKENATVVDNSVCGMIKNNKKLHRSCSTRVRFTYEEEEITISVDSGRREYKQGDKMDVEFPKGNPKDVRQWTDGFKFTYQMIGGLFFFFAGLSLINAIMMFFYRRNNALKTATGAAALFSLFKT